MNKYIQFIIDKNFRFSVLASRGVFNYMSDEKFLKKKYKLVFHKELNLDNPQTFNEKLQWLKLYDRKPSYTTLVDKFAVRKYIANIIGEEYLIPLLGVWDCYEDINFDALPNQFVLKPTHTSGDVFVCRDKRMIDYGSLRREVNRWLKRRYYWVHREWPYKNVNPRIIAEKYMVDESGVELKDYKFFCFYGEPKMMFVATDRGVDTRFDFYDMKFNHLSFIQHYKNSTKKINKPVGFDKMILLAKILSKGIPHVRVDFYDINGETYFGELTFYHFSGFERFEPEEWDYKLGKWIKLPDIRITSE